MLPQKSLNTWKKNIGVFFPRLAHFMAPLFSKELVGQNLSIWNKGEGKSSKTKWRESWNLAHKIISI